MRKAVYIYIDEAGDFNYSPNGSRYFILTCVVMRRPFAHVADLAALKYDQLERGLDPKRSQNYQRFHATEDKQHTRDRVFGVITRKISGARVYSVIIRKNKVNPSIRSAESIYSKTFQWLIGYVANRERIEPGTLVVAVTDSINLKGKNAALKSALRKFMEQRFASAGISYKLYQHQSPTDPNLQVADYCCWAIQRKWEKGDSRSYDLIAHMVFGEGDLFKNGDMEYYRFDNDPPT